MKKTKFDKFCIFWIWIAALYLGFHLYRAFDRHLYELPVEIALLGCVLFGCAGGGLLIYFGDKLHIYLKRHFEEIRHERRYQRMSRNLETLKKMEVNR